MRLSRRTLLCSAGAGLALPRVAIAQADQRPSITIAVQKISISNTLESLREVSNVGQRTMSLFTEALMASIAQSAPEAKARVRAFLEGKAAKVKKQ